MHLTFFVLFLFQTLSNGAITSMAAYLWRLKGSFINLSIFPSKSDLVIISTVHKAFESGAGHQKQKINNVKSGERL